MFEILMNVISGEWAIIPSHFDIYTNNQPSFHKHFLIYRL